MVSTAIQRVTTPAGDSAWLVTNYDDVKALLSDPRLGLSHAEPERAARVSPQPSAVRWATRPNSQSTPGCAPLRTGVLRTADDESAATGEGNYHRLARRYDGPCAAG